MTTSLAAFRLLQITDSAFPVGGFAYSHGLEWLAQDRHLSEPELAALLATYIDQVEGGQSLPAALASHRAHTPHALRRIDSALDASILPEGERNAGRAMGERLLVGALDAFGPNLPRCSKLLAAVRESTTPGQYPIAFGALAGETGAGEAETLRALGFSMVTSITQAAVRLGLVGQAAAGRLVADAATQLEATIARVLAAPPRRPFGAFSPTLDVAAVLHPTLTFRMFAS